MNTFNKKAVIETAAQLDELFIKHLKASPDVEAAYKQCKPLIDRAKSGQIDEPTDKRLPAGYFSTEFDLFGLRDLYKTASLLDVCL